MSHEGVPPQDPSGDPAYGQQPPPAGPYGAPPYAAGPVYPGYPGYGQASGLPPGGYANWGDRAVATLWDIVYVLPALVGEFVGVILIIIGAALVANDSGFGTVLVIIGVLVLVGAIVYGLWLYIRNYLLDQGRTGYTYGKRKVGIRTVAEATGQPAGVGSAVLRWLLHSIINQALYIDYLWPLWDEKKQTLTDKILTTVVVRQPDAS